MAALGSKFEMKILSLDGSMTKKEIMEENLDVPTEITQE